MTYYTVTFPDVDRAYTLLAESAKSAIEQATENMQFVCRFAGKGRIYGPDNRSA